MTVGGPTVTLSNGVQMPLVGLGTWQSTDEDVKRALRSALDEGYRLIDTATVYSNEEAIGEVVEEYIKAGKVKREDLFITTKCWTNNLRAGDVTKSARESLKKLRLDYVDLYLAHMPAAAKPDMSGPDPDVKVEEIWQALEEVYNLGLAKAIGVSNWSGKQIERALAIAKVPIHNLQVELWLYFPQHELHALCKKHGISLTSYASLGSPGRSKFVLPNGQRLNWPESDSALENKDVVALAAKYGKTPAQVLLRYLLDRGIAVIPKSVNPQRVHENFQLFDFKLTPEEVEQLNGQTYRKRIFIQDFMIGHPEDPFVDER